MHLGLNIAIINRLVTALAALCLATGCTVKMSAKGSSGGQGAVASSAATSLSFVSAFPASPSNTSSTPLIRGTAPSSAATVKLFSNPTCTVEIGSGTATDYATLGIVATLTANATTAIYGHSINGAGQADTCVSLTTFTHDNIVPAAPSSLTLITPASSPNQDATPLIRISGTSSGLTVNLYSDSGCIVASLKGSGTASGANIDITSASLADGAYSFYASSTDPAGNVSTCSTATVAYTVDTTAPAAPSALTLQDPASSPGSDTTPQIRVSGVFAGNTVELHSNSTCTALLASGTAAGVAIDLTSPALAAGSHVFYAKTLDPVGNTSTCSTANVAYALDTTAPSAPTGLALQNPSTSPSNDTSPQIRVSGVVSGDSIELHSNSTCSSLKASGVASSTTIDLTSSALTAGTYTFYAKAADSAGNASGCSAASVGYVLDLTAPADPTGLALQSPTTSPSNDTTPQIRVSGVTAGDIIELHTNSTCSSLQASGTAAGATIDLTSSALSAGTHTFYARATDLAGNASGCSTTSVAYTLDLSAPTDPTGLALQSPASSPANDSTPQIRVSGVASGDTVELHADAACSSLKATGTAAGATIDLTSSALTAGTYVFYAKATDAAGNASGCSAASVAYVLDLTAPADPSGLALQDPATTPSNDTTPQIRVSGVTSGDTIELHADSACSSLKATGTAAGTTIDLTSSALSAGTYTFYAKASDPSGNASSCSTANVSYVLDLTAPGIPSGLALQDPASSPANDATPEVRVSGLTAGDTVELHSNSTCSSLKASGTAAGATLDLTSSALGAGTYTFYAKATDPSGNASACSTASVSYVLDLTAPGAPSVLTLQDPSASPSSDTTPQIRVSGVVSGDTVELHADSACSSLKATGTAAGASIDLTSSALSAGTYTFYAKSIDAVGNASGCSTANVSYDLDTSAPAAPSGLALQSPASTPDSDTTPQIRISGVVSGDAVELHSNSTCTSLKASGTAAGTTIDLTSSALSIGTYAFYAKAADPAGNASACSVATVAYEVIAGPPGVPSGLALQDPSASPSNDTTPQIRVSGVANGETVRLYADSSCSIPSYKGTATASGTSADVTTSALSAGSYTFYATTDNGTESACSTASVTYLLDLTAPSDPSGLALQDPSSSPENDTTPQIRVSGVVSGDTVELHSNSSCTSLVATGTAGGSTIDLTSSALAAGSYTFYAKATDPSGNASGCSSASVTYVLDLTAPADPSGLALQDPASSPGNDTTPQIRVSGVASGDSVELHSNSSCTSLKGSGTSAGATIDLTSSALTAGSYTFYAKATDPAGNASSCSTANVAYVLDVTAPDAPTGLALQSPATSPNNDTTPQIRISGVLSGDTVELHSNSTCSGLLASGTAGGVTIDLTPAALGAGTHTFYAKAADPAGNASGCSTASVAYVLDLTAPDAPTGLALQSPSTTPNNDTTPQIRISGVVSGDTVELHSNSSCSSLQASGTASGTTLDLTTGALTAGAYTFYAKSIDPAGNPSACTSASVAYTLDTTAPDAPTGLALQSPSSSPANDTTPQIRISGVTSGDTVELHSNSLCSSLKGSGTASGATIDLTSSALSSGSYTFYSKATDPAGNASGCSTANVAYVLDLTAPDAPTGLALLDPASTPENDTTPQIRVSGVTSGDTIELHSNSICSSLKATGTASGVTIDLTSSALSAGSYTFYAKAIDASGNASGCSTASVAYVLDLSAPSAPSALALQDPNSSPGNDTTPQIRISGVVSGDAVELHADSACSSLKGSGTASGTTIDLTSSALTAGTYAFYAKATDAAGNASACSTASVSYVLDLTAPSAPSGLALQDPSSSPENDTTPQIRVSGVTSGDSVELHTDSACSSLVGSGTASGVTVDLTSSALTAGTYAFYAKATDPAGNASACSTANVAYVLDLTAPGVPSGLALQDPATSPSTDTTPTIRVSGVTSGDTVELHTNSSCTSLQGSGTAGGATVDIASSDLTSGSYTFYARAIDPYGNASACSTASVSYTLNGSGPSAPTGLALQNPSTSPSNDTTPTIRVSGVATGFTVKLYSDASCTVLKGSVESTGTTADVTSSVLTGGSYSFYATASNSGGTESTCSTATVAYVLDTTAPTAPSGLTLQSPATSPADDVTPTIRVSGVTSGDTIELHTDSACGSLKGSTTASGATADITSSELSGGSSYTFYALARDPSGNFTCSTANVAYSPTRPTAPTVTGTTPVTDTQPLWSWTAGGGGNGTYRYRLDNSDLSTGTTTTTSTTFVPGSALSTGSHTLYVQEQSAGGAWSTSGSFAITIVDENFNIDFGYRLGATLPNNNISPYNGGAAANPGNTTDYWNAVEPRSLGTVSFSNFSNTDGTSSTLGVSVTGATGVWWISTADEMYYEYIYRSSTSGGVGNIPIQLSGLAQGSYDLYVYGHGNGDSFNGVFEVSSNGVNYGTQYTTSAPGWTSVVWQEGIQYVKYANVAAVNGQDVTVLVKPCNTGCSTGDSSIHAIQIVRAAPVAPTLAFAGSSALGYVNAPLSISPTTLSNGGTSITSCGIKSGSTPATLPAGLSVHANTCVISGTPTASAASATYTLVATNSVGTSADATVTFAVDADPGILKTNLKLWLRADSISGVSNGDGIGTWLDDSTNANHATQATASARPIYKASGPNGKPALTFAVGDIMDLPNVAQAATSTVFVVYNATTTGLRVILDRAGTSSGPGIYSGKTGPASYKPTFVWGGTTAAHSSALTSGTNALVFYQFTATDGKITINGSDAGAATIAHATATVDQWTAISSTTNNNEFAGDIAEILIYNQALSATERDAVRSYLNTKYNLY